jgi:membrane protein DedA with SNARE-associated domain
MMEAVEAFAAWMQGLPPLGVYAVAFAVSWGEYVFPPLPADVALVLIGSLVALGVVGLVPVFAVALVGSVLGFMTMYALGRRLGPAIHDPTRLRWIPRGPVRAVDAWMARWGVGVVAANRFLSGGRAVIGLVVGASGLRPGPAAFWAAVSAFLWNSLVLGGGYALGSEWERVVDFLRLYGKVVTGVIAAVALVLAVRWWTRRRTAAPTG